MIVVDSERLDQYRFDSEQTLWVYNNLDCCVTRQLRDIFVEQLDEQTGEIYRFERAMMGPALAMMRRGFKIDLAARDRWLWGEQGLVKRLYTLCGMERNPKKSGPKWIVTDESALLQRYAKALIGKTVSYQSSKQLQELLYGGLHIDPITKRVKDRVVITTDHEALNSLIEAYPRARPLCLLLLRIKELEAQVEILTKRLDEDGRIRCSYNIAGTETGRFSSSRSAFNTGTNLQNINEELRSLFVADEGKILFSVDLKSAESLAVGYLSKDEAYIEACESRDIHTAVASLVFGIPEDPKEAAVLYYKQHSYRFMAKRCGHGTNYMLTPHSLARNMHIEVREAYKFHLLYIGGEILQEQALRWGFQDMQHEKVGEGIWRFEGAFPKIKEWHGTTRDELQDKGYLVTPFGRKRVFWGSVWRDETIREAIAYRPQSLVVDLLNAGMWKVWYHLEWKRGDIEILHQGHDSIVAQCDKKKLDELLPLVLELIVTPIRVRGRVMTIAADVKTGHNWRDMKDWP